jgi:hypothetical protein
LGTFASVFALGWRWPAGGEGRKIPIPWEIIQSFSKFYPRHRKIPVALTTPKETQFPLKENKKNRISSNDSHCTSVLLQMTET